MPNPNYSELRLMANYGQDDTRASGDGQGTRVEVAASTDSDEVDHKYVEEVYLAGKYVELAHYASVKQIVIQNISEFWGVTFHADATTTAVVPDYIAPGEHISINNVDVTAGLMLYARFGGTEASRWELAICGRKD
jgi:hypothetical protein